MSRQLKPPQPEQITYTPPASAEAEQSVLGAILIRPEVLDRIADILSPADFYREAHGIIYRAMLDLYAKNEPVDLVTVNGLLKERGQREAVGGAVFLAGLSSEVGFATNAVYYALKVKEKADLRRLLDATQEIAGACLAPVENLAEFMDMAESRIFEATHSKLESKIQSLGELAQADWQELETIHHTGQESHGLITGYYDYDRLTSGLHPGDLTIMAARPGMGKTALALNVSWNTGGKQGQTVAFFSLEMPKKQLVRRIVSSIAEIDGTHLRRCRLSNEEWVLLARVQDDLQDAPIFIDDRAGISVLELRAKCRRLKARHGLSLVVVDYLQLMADPPRAQSRHIAVSHNSRKLKELAKELEVPVLALCQVSREVEKDKRKKYRLADLKESGDIEQDADNVLFLWRDKDAVVAECTL